MSEDRDYDAIADECARDYWNDKDQEQKLTEKIHALNELNLDQSFVTTKRELLEKLK